MQIITLSQNYESISLDYEQLKFKYHEVKQKHEQKMEEVESQLVAEKFQEMNRITSSASNSADS